MDREWQVDENTGAGLRLDRALEARMPDLGLRARRRLIAKGSILLNGSPASPGVKIRKGDKISWSGDASGSQGAPRGQLLGYREDLIFFYKPSGLHTAAISGSSADSLERQIPELLKTGSDIPRLLQRLDFETSGLVTAALDNTAIRNFRTAEKKGSCDKLYLALLSGSLEKSIACDNKLFVTNTKKTRVSAKKGGRRTILEPLYIWQNGMPALFGKVCQQSPITLALCSLQAGARHQIRAHAAHVGFPLAGDSLYGSQEADCFWLQHFCLRMPGLLIQLPERFALASWLPDSEKIRPRLKASLKRRGIPWNPGGGFSSQLPAPERG